ncbi:uncharacterized protein LOC144630920 [Oculina patagonica]
MGVCCTKDARPTGTSSSRHFVSVCSSPGRFPAENEYRQESAVENAAEKAIIKTDDHPMCVEHRKTPEHHHQRKRECLENASQQRNRLTGSAKKRSDQSFAENDGEDRKNVATKPRCAGAIQRLKKKDSTRQPKYKDEIMLSENIDSIVEKEIPEIPDEVAALASDVDSILSDDKPAVESRAASTSSSEVTPRPSARRRKKKRKKHDKPVNVKAKDTEEGDSASSPFAISSVSIPTLKKNLSQEMMDEEDIRVEQEIRSMLKDDPFNGEPSAPTPNDADEASEVRKEDATKTPTDLNTLEQEVEEVDLSPPTTSILSQMHSDSLASLDIEQHREKYQKTEKVITDDEKLALDIDYILNDDKDTNESKPKSSSRAVSDKKKPQRPKESFTKEQNSKENKELSKNIGVASAELKIFSGKVSPTKMAQRPKNSSRKEQKNTAEKELANDTYFILSDDFGTAEVNNKITSGTVSPIKKKQRPSKYPMGAKQNAVGEELAKDIFIDFGNAEISSGVVSPAENSQRPMNYSTIQDTKKAEDEKLANAINYILSDDVATHEASDVTVSPRKKTLPPTTYNKETPKTVDEELANDIRFILSDDVGPADESNTDDTSSRTVSPTKNAQRRINSIKEKKNAEDEKLAKDGDDVAIKEEISSGGVSSMKKAQYPSKKCSTRKAKHKDDKKHSTDINHALNDDHPAVKSISKRQISSGKASPRKKVSFQELDQEDDNLAKEIKYILEDDVGEVVPNAKNSLSLCKLPPPKKDLTRKHSKQADDQLAKDIAEILSDYIFAVEPDVPIPCSPSEIPRPKTSNPKLLLAMDMDRLLNPESIDSSNQADEKLAEDIEFILNDDLVDVTSNGRIPLRSESAQRVEKQSVTETSKETGDKRLKSKQTLQDKTVQFTLKERHSLGPREASRPKKKIPTRKSRNVADETTSKASNSSPTPSLLPKSDFSSRSGSKHPRTDSSRIIENIKDKALSKSTDYIVEEESTAESVRSNSCTSSSLPRPKSRNPKRAFAMNKSETQSSSLVASSCRAVQRPKQDYNRKPRHTTCKLAHDASVESASSGKPLSSSSAIQRTDKDSTKKPEDMLILEELDSNMEIAPSSCVVLQSSKDSTRRQNRATNQDSNQPKKTAEDADLDNIINAILDIPTVDCGTSGCNVVMLPAKTARRFAGEWMASNLGYSNSRLCCFIPTESTVGMSKKGFHRVRHV